MSLIYSLFCRCTNFDSFCHRQPSLSVLVAVLEVTLGLKKSYFSSISLSSLLFSEIFVGVYCFLITPTSLLYWNLLSLLQEFDQILKFYILHLAPSSFKKQSGFKLVSFHFLIRSSHSFWELSRNLTEKRYMEMIVNDLFDVKGAHHGLSILRSWIYNQ